MSSDTSIKKRSVNIAGHRTSVSVEAPFWEALKELAAREDISLNDLIARIDGTRAEDFAGNLSSAIRVYVLNAVRR